MSIKDGERRIAKKDRRSCRGPLYSLNQPLLDKVELVEALIIILVVVVVVLAFLTAIQGVMEASREPRVVKEAPASFQKAPARAIHYI